MPVLVHWNYVLCTNQSSLLLPPSLGVFYSLNQLGGNLFEYSWMFNSSWLSFGVMSPGHHLYPKFFQVLSGRHYFNKNLWSQVWVLWFVHTSFVEIVRVLLVFQNINVAHWKKMRTLHLIWMYKIKYVHRTISVKTRLTIMIKL